ncbi:MAG: hypothetical protein UT00_C0021G0005 [Parcubacteria group bacterium GW2011_GWA1_38_7]|nr:MAG: hypothetical protein UT00_C0021G0005 [Parcubacteria group bacterium GW2011_GWA1_38_7]
MTIILCYNPLRMTERKGFTICEACKMTQPNKDCDLTNFWDTNIKFQTPLYLVNTIENNPTYAQCPNRDQITGKIITPKPMLPSRRR